MAHVLPQAAPAVPAAWIVPLTIALLGMLGGCGSTPTQASRAAEKQRLETELHGTPAVLALQADNSLGVDIPLRSCFDRGRATVKPSLAKVLDRMAASQRNETSRILVSAPTDRGDKALALAMQRAVAARDYLVERGLDASRFSVSAVAGKPVVKIVVAGSSNGTAW